MEIAPSGGKLWRLRYRFRGKEKRLALGAYPEPVFWNAICSLGWGHSRLGASPLLSCWPAFGVSRAGEPLPTAHRARQTCGQVFRYAISTGRADRDPSRDLIGALPPVKGGHFAATLEPRRLAEILEAMNGYQGTLVVRAALRLAPMLFVRPGELRRAEWPGTTSSKRSGATASRKRASTIWCPFPVRLWRS